MATPPPSPKPIPYPVDALAPVLSPQTVRWHHDEHEAEYARRATDIERRLAELRAGAPAAHAQEWGELKRKEALNVSGAILHPLYWGSLGGAGGGPEGALRASIERDFGSVEAWRRDFVATARAALGWAVLAYDPSAGRLRNCLVDFHHQGAVWGAIPLLALDVWEHAYQRDYGADKARYIDACLGILDWRAIEVRWDRAAHPPG